MQWQHDIELVPASEGGLDGAVTSFVGLKQRQDLFRISHSQKQNHEAQLVVLLLYWGCWLHASAAARRSEGFVDKSQKEDETTDGCLSGIQGGR